MVADESKKSSYRGYAYAGAMLCGLLVGVIADNQQFQHVMRAGESGGSSGSCVYGSCIL